MGKLNRRPDEAVDIASASPCGRIGGWLRGLIDGVPRRHRLPLLTWIGVYPVLTAIAVALEPWLVQAPVALRTLVMSIIMVPAMVYVVMPFMRRNFMETRPCAN